MKSSYDLVLFDLDGTLLETAPEICDAVNDTLRRFDLASVTQDRVERWIGHGTRELLVQALAFATKTGVGAIGSSASLRLIEAEFDKNYYGRCGTRSQPYPNAIEVLGKLRAAGTKLALVTNKEGAYTRRLLDAHRMGALFDRVVSGDSFPNRKPDPDGVLSCLCEFAVAPRQALFVGDSSIDVKTARNVGVSVWTVAHGYNMGEPIANSDPDCVLDNFNDLWGKFSA